MFKKIIEFIKKKLKDIWNKIKKLVDKLIRLFKGHNSKIYNPGLTNLIDLCNKHSADLATVPERDIIEVITEKEKNPKYVYETIIRESYRYVVLPGGVMSILSGSTLKDNYAFGGESLQKIAYLIDSIKDQLFIVSNGNYNKALNKLLDIVKDVEIYDYSSGKTFIINNEFDLVPVDEKTITTNAIKKVYTLDCSSVIFFLKTHIEDISKNFEEYYSKYIKGTQGEVNDMLYKLDKRLENINDSLSELNQYDLYLIKKIILFLVPRLIKIYISNGKYLINPTIETWAKYSYIYLQDELKKKI